MLAYAAVRLIVIFAATSVSDAVWAQEIPGIAMLVIVMR
jgi:hypothetical protein